MANAKEAKAKVSLDPSDFEKGAKAIVSAANDMSAAVKVALAATGVAILAVFGAETLSAIASSAHGVITLGEEMANAGKKAGLAAGQFYLFHNAIEKGLSLKTVANLIGENADVLNRSANTFRDVSIKLWVVGEKIRGFWLGLMDRVAPVLSRLLDGALGVSLVKAGEDFGEAIVNTGKVLFQMFEDGELWKNVTTIAAASFTYLGNIISGLVQIALSDAFAEGWQVFVDDAKTAIEWFADNFGKLFLSVIVRIETSFMEMWIRVLGKIASLTSPLIHLIPGDDKSFDKVVNRIAELSNTVGGKVQDKLQVDAPKFGGSTVSSQFQDLFKNTKFEIPSIDGKPAEQIGNIFQKYLDKFNAKNLDADSPGRHYENNNRQKTFGVDSLAAIGAGGNVYIGLGLLDYNRLQYRELQEINRKLGGDRGHQNGANIFLEAIGNKKISRAQVGSVVN